MHNLRDKLLKAGLVSVEQAAEAVPAAASHGRAAPKGTPLPKAASAPAAAPLVAVRREPLLPKLPPLPGSREAQRLESRKRLEQDKALHSRVSAALVPLSPGERSFYFVTRKNRLRRLELSAEQASALESGLLAVVECPEPGQIGHALVPADTAEALLKDFPKAVRFFNRAGAPVGFLSEEDLRSRQTSEAEQDGAPAPAVEAQGGEPLSSSSGGSGRP